MQTTNTSGSYEPISSTVKPLWLNFSLFSWTSWWRPVQIWSRPSNCRRKCGYRCDGEQLPHPPSRFQQLSARTHENRWRRRCGGSLCRLPVDPLSQAEVMGRDKCIRLFFVPSSGRATFHVGAEDDRTLANAEKNIDGVEEIHFSLSSILLIEWRCGSVKPS